MRALAALKDRSQPRSKPVSRSVFLQVASIVALAGVCVAATACSPAASPQPARSPVAQKWFDRAQAAYRTVDVEDAQDAVAQALRAAPDDPDVKLLAANLALARLDFEEAKRLTGGLTDPRALSVRGRALWYAGDVRNAGIVLETLLRDPEVHDPWAKAISKLANLGAGRTPYRASGNIVAVAEMPHVRGAALIVPVEVDGDQGLALVATGTAEVVLDSAVRKEPSWVSIRIGDGVEFGDVPAVTQDLSGLSRQLSAPIKALLGVNFLRHANPTFDYEAHQFVVRRFLPPRPPTATDVPIFYIRGGGMVMRSALKSDNAASHASLMIDSSMLFPLTLDEEGWRKAGVSTASLTPVPEEPSLKQGTVPLLRVGQFDLPQVAGVLGKEIATLETSLGLDIDGVVGAGLLAGFRVTLGDAGRVMWIEEEVVADTGPTPTEAASGAPDGSLAPPAQPTAPGATGSALPSIAPPVAPPAR
jgi:hypothetical protein